MEKAYFKDPAAQRTPANFFGAEIARYPCVRTARCSVDPATASIPREDLR